MTLILLADFKHGSATDTLLERILFFAFRDKVVCILANFDNFRAALACSQHQTLVDVMKVQRIVVFVGELWVDHEAEFTATFSGVNLEHWLRLMHRLWFFPRLLRRLLEATKLIERSSAGGTLGFQSLRCPWVVDLLECFVEHFQLCNTKVFEQWFDARAMHFVDFLDNTVALLSDVRVGVL